MDTKEYTFYVTGQSAVCPACSGLVLVQEEEAKCIDCGERFSIKRTGMTDREIICTQIG